MKEDTLIYLGDDKHPYRVVLTFVSNDDKHYIVYTDDEIDDEGFIKTYAGIYAARGDKEVLLPVEDEEDFQLIDGLLRKLEKEEK